jgi:hypothetical protein
VENLYPVISQAFIPYLYRTKWHKGQVKLLRYHDSYMRKSIARYNGSYMKEHASIATILTTQAKDQSYTYARMRHSLGLPIAIHCLLRYGLFTSGIAACDFDWIDINCLNSIIDLNSRRGVFTQLQ